MFDNIGRDLDEQANRRRAESLVYTTLLVGSAVGIFAWFTARAAIEVIEQFEDLEMVQIEIDEDIDDAAPPPPPPPPPGGDDDEEEEVLEPDEVVEEVQELKEIIEEKPIVKAKEQAGEEGGHELGVVGGKIGGTPGGDPNSPCEPGDPRCTGVGGRIVSYKDVKVKNMVQPTYPTAARSMNLGDQRCRVTVSIDAKGVPEDVKVKGCPEVFHDEVKRAMFKSRWWPYKSGGSKLAAQFTILITFRLS